MILLRIILKTDIFYGFYGKSPVYVINNDKVFLVKLTFNAVIKNKTNWTSMFILDHFSWLTSPHGVCRLQESNYITSQLLTPGASWIPGGWGDEQRHLLHWIRALILYGHCPFTTSSLVVFTMPLVNLMEESMFFFASRLYFVLFSEGRKALKTVKTFLCFIVATTEKRKD